MAKKGLDDWFKQKWVDIGSKRKRRIFCQVWEVETKERREKEVSEVCPACESKKDVGKSKTFSSL